MTVKQKIEKAFEQQDQAAIEQLMPIYLQEYKADYDRFSILCNYELMHDHLEKAREYAKEAVLLNPYCLDADYNMAYASDCCGDLASAYLYYLRLLRQQNLRKNEIVAAQVLVDRLNEIEAFADEKRQSGDNELYQKLLHVRRVMQNSIEDQFRFARDIVGQIFFDEKEQGYYVSAFGDWYNTHWNEHPPMSAAETKVEIMPISTIDNQALFDMDGDFILPVVANTDYKDSANIIVVNQGGQLSYFTTGNKQSYYYMKLHGQTAVASDKDIVMAKPIPVRHYAGNKKLVLSLFIDSFNWRVFELAGENQDAVDGMKKLIPNTYRFFQKGTICSNAYVDSEWTTPSLSTYMTGVYSSTHMNLDNDIWYPYEDQFKLLTEYFKERGYVTATINGNDACTPAKGYMRGMDREIYRESGYPKDQIVMDALEHMRTFDGCDQFLLLQMEDLHEVAGGFMRSPSVQINTEVDDFTVDNTMKSTVKQSRSIHKQHIYMNELKSMDFYLGLLYDYITSHYKEEEYVVSLFSDHGTAFLVDDDQPIICNQRMHVPMFFRSEKHCGELKEMVQSVDYGKILCYLTDIPYNQQLSDAQLPKEFGGEKKRDYTFSHTIFVGDVYQAMIRDDECTFYLSSKEPVDSEFHFSLDDANIRMIDHENRPYQNFEKMNFYKSIVYDKIGHLVKYK